MLKIFVVLLSIFFFQSSVHGADNIRIGLPDLSTTFMPLPLAQKRGFLQQEGLQAESIRIRGGVASAALVGGEIDYWTGLGGTVAAAIQGLPVKIVACYMPGAPTPLIARPEFKSVQELRGKTIGINAPGGTLHNLARLMLKHFGLDPDKDVKFLTVGPNEARFAAMKQGVVAATLGSEFLGKKMGFVVLARAYELFSYPDSGLVASVKKIKEKPDEVKRVIRASIKANRYIHQNSEGTIQFMVEWLRIDKELATATYDSISKAFNEDGNIPEDGLRLIIEDAKKAAKVDREVSINEVADLSILKEAQRELGIKSK